MYASSIFLDDLENCSWCSSESVVEEENCAAAALYRAVFGLIDNRRCFVKVLFIFLVEGFINITLNG